jgi:hypothetical protein
MYLTPLCLTYFIRNRSVGRFCWRSVPLDVDKSQTAKEEPLIKCHGTEDATRLRARRRIICSGALAWMLIVPGRGRRTSHYQSTDPMFTVRHESAKFYLYVCGENLPSLLIDNLTGLARSGFYACFSYCSASLLYILARFIGIQH